MQCGGVDIMYVLWKWNRGARSECDNGRAEQDDHGLFGILVLAPDQIAPCGLGAHAPVERFVRQPPEFAAIDLARAFAASAGPLPRAGDRFEP